jgi:halocyanin-like protein
MSLVKRRDVLRAGAGLAGAAALAPAAAAQSAGLESWFSDVSNFDGVVDRTGQSEVTVTVGSEANGGNYGFGPAAIRVDPGTTVVWEWNGKGGAHNVVDQDGGLESELTAEAGFTFSHTFESAGVTKYYCVPHEALGMKGAVVVGDVEVGVPAASGGGGSGGGGSGSGGGGGGGASGGGDGGTGGDGSGPGGGPMDGPGAGSPGDGSGMLLIAGGIVGAFLSPLLLALVLLFRREGGSGEDAEVETSLPERAD